MTLASPLRRLPAAALAFVLGASARTAAADPPPADLPPLSGAAVGAPVPGQQAPAPPGKPVVPPRAPASPPGLSWTTPGEVPPGYVNPSPGYYPYPYPAPYPAAQPQPVVDPYSLPPLPPRRRKDVGLFVGGVVAVLGGMSMALVGSYFVSSAAGRIEIFCDMPSAPCAHKTDQARLNGGAILMAAGAALGAAGIPMWFIGSQYVVVPKEERQQALQVEVRFGAGGGGAILRF
jgi:hypothetical protein